MLTGSLPCSIKVLLFKYVEWILLKEDAQCPFEGKPLAWWGQDQSIRTQTGSAKAYKVQQEGVKIAKFLRAYFMDGPFLYVFECRLLNLNRQLWCQLYTNNWHTLPTFPILTTQCHVEIQQVFPKPQFKSGNVKIEEKILEANTVWSFRGLWSFTFKLCSTI